MIRHACGTLCLAMSRGPVRPPRPGAAARPQPRPVGHAVHAQLRRPRSASPPAPRPSTAPHRSRSPSTTARRPHDLVLGKGHVDGLRARDGRRAGAGRAHRGERRPGPAGRPQGGGGHLRGHHAGRAHGPAAGPAASSAPARAEDVHDRGPDQVPPAARAAHHDARSALKLPTTFGEFDLFAYTSMVDPEPHLALSPGRRRRRGERASSPEQEEPVLVRIHSQCLTGDMFGSVLVRLRLAAAQGDAADRRGRQGRHPVHAAGGPRHRAVE